VSKPSLLDRLDRIRVVSWEWNEEAAPLGEIPGERRIGVIAQELEEIFPELVTTGPEGYKRVDYSALAALALLGVQELRRELHGSRGAKKKKAAKRRSR
jgi:hypothetical protein